MFRVYHSGFGVSGFPVLDLVFRVLLFWIYCSGIPCIFRRSVFCRSWFYYMTILTYFSYKVEVIKHYFIVLLSFLTKGYYVFRQEICNVKHLLGKDKNSPYVIDKEIKLLDQPSNRQPTSYFQLLYLRNVFYGENYLSWWILWW